MKRKLMFLMFLVSTLIFVTVPAVHGQTYPGVEHDNSDLVESPEANLCRCPPGSPNCPTPKVGSSAGDTFGPCRDFSNDTQAILAAFGDTASEMGLEIDQDQATVLTAYGATIVAAPSRTLEDTPVLEMLNGGVLGLSFVSIPGSDIPPGFYRSRAFIDGPGPFELGRHDVSVALTDENDRVAAVLQGFALVGSLDLPPEPREATVIGSLVPSVFEAVDSDFFVPPLPSIELIDVGVVFELWWLCDNGAWICVRVEISASFF